MESIIHSVKTIAQKIADSEKKRQKLAEFVKQVSPETGLVVKSEASMPKNISVAGVDGGLLKKSLHGMDCMIVRAAGACFSYSGNRIEKVEYFPSRNPAPKPIVYEALSEADWMQFASLNRVIEEVATARECIRKLRPDILLMDGMLMPHYMDKSSNSDLYKTALDQYKKLFSESIESKTVLVGIVEDSRSTSFCDYLNSSVLSKVSHDMVSELQSLLGKTNDSSLLFLALEHGERTRTFPSANPAQTDFGIPQIQTFYLKTAKYDRPLRVEFLPESIDPDSLSSILLSISGHHSGYGLPAPLIEADNVAKLPESEMDSLYSSILSLIRGSAGITGLRRENRPF